MNNGILGFTLGISLARLYHNLLTHHTQRLFSYDKLFKGYMGDPENAKGFAKHNFPREILEIINLNTLHPEKDTFISGALKEMYSDLLFSVDIRGEAGYIYMLFEHKSYVDKKVGFQLLKTMVMIWDRLLNRRKKKKVKLQDPEPTETNHKDAETEGTAEIPQHLPIVIPILFYHGEKAWNLPASFQILFNDYANLAETVQEMIPNFRYLCYDFSDPVRRQAKGDLLFEIYLMVQDFVYINDQEKSQQMLREIFKRIQMIRNIDRLKKHLEMFFKYMLHTKENLKAETFMETLESMETERSDIMPTIAEQLIVKGKLIGREEGIQEGSQKILKIQLEDKFKGIPKAYLKRVDGLSAKQTLELSLALKKMTDWKELDAYLSE